MESTTQSSRWWHRVSGVVAASILVIHNRSEACSNFAMDGDPYRISVRTMDLGFGQFDILVEPPSRTAAYGRAAFVAGSPRVPLQRFVVGGLNAAGLSCDLQTLLNASYPAVSAAATVTTTDEFCGVALANYASARTLADDLREGRLAIVQGVIRETHFVVRDSSGASVIVEAFDGLTLETLVDLNDGGATGVGVMTNEPAIAHHLANVRMAQWKQTLERPALAMPGAFYPDDRFLRVWLLKSAMPPPTSYAVAVQQAVHVLNSITVPMGDPAQLGTDTGGGSGESGSFFSTADHTLYGVVYDHLNATFYYRTYKNQNLQKVDLNAALAAFAPVSSSSEKTSALVLPVISDDLPWYNDVTPAFQPAELLPRSK